jgi:hypothetical protein
VNATLVVGLLLLGGCVFTAGWVAGAHGDAWLRLFAARRARRRARSRRNRPGYMNTRTPW